MRQKPFLKFPVFGLPRAENKGAGGTPEREQRDRSFVSDLKRGKGIERPLVPARVVGFISPPSKRS